MHYITPLAKFGNCCRYGFVGKTNEGATTSLSFWRMQIKSYMLFLQCIWTWFSIPAYYNIFGYEKLSQRKHVLLLWWSGTVATVLKSLKSVVRNISLRTNICLYSCATIKFILMPFWILETGKPFLFLMQLLCLFLGKSNYIRLQFHYNSVRWKLKKMIHSSLQAQTTTS